MRCFEGMVNDTKSDYFTELGQYVSVADILGGMDSSHDLPETYETKVAVG